MRHQPSATYTIYLCTPPPTHRLSRVARQSRSLPESPFHPWLGGVAGRADPEYRGTLGRCITSLFVSRAGGWRRALPACTPDRQDTNGRKLCCRAMGGLPCRGAEVLATLHQARQTPCSQRYQPLESSTYIGRARLITSYNTGVMGWWWWLVVDGWYGWGTMMVDVAM